HQRFFVPETLVAGSRNSPFNPISAVNMSKKKGLRVVLQMVTVSTLLFVGWGLNDLGNFFAAPPRVGLFLLLLVCNAAETLCLNGDPFATGRKLGDCQCWI